MNCTPIIAGDFCKKVIPLIDVAKQNIDVCVFDWRWYENDPGSPVQLFNQSIVRAIRRGVSVRAVVNSDSIANVLRSVGVNVKKCISKHLLHSKFLIIDNSVLITGSHNYTQSAFTSNFEFSVALFDGVDLTDLNNFFERLLV